MLYSVIFILKESTSSDEVLLSKRLEEIEQRKEVVCRAVMPSDTSSLNPLLLSHNVGQDQDCCSEN